MHMCMRMPIMSCHFELLLFLFQKMQSIAFYFAFGVLLPSCVRPRAATWNDTEEEGGKKRGGRER